MVVSRASELTSGRIGRGLVLLFLLAAGLLGCVLLGLKIGYPPLNWPQLFSLLFAGEGSELQRLSVLEIRLPRIVLGMLSGALLGLAGVLLQDSLKNPLAGPELLGVSAGASLTIAVITVFHLPVAFALHAPLALLGGIIGGGLVLAAASGRHSSVNFILIGAAVTAILNGMVVWVVTMGAANDAILLYTYLLGNLAGRNWSHVENLLPWALVGIPAALCFARPLNVLRLGDEAAEGLGMRVARMRMLMLLVCCGMVAAVVAQCGPIGYIALIAPHAVRFLLRASDARLVLPLSAVMGALLLISADLLAKTVFMPREVPVGLWTTLIGGPILLLLFGRSMGRRQHEGQS